MRGGGQAEQRGQDVQEDGRRGEKATGGKDQVSESGKGDGRRE